MDAKNTTQLHKYNIIPNTENIISSLIDNINNNDLFQKHINKLESSTKDKEQKKAKMIKNTISNIRIFNNKINPLFLAKDIGILLGISHIKILVKKFEKEEKVIGYITGTNNKTKQVIFLSKLGVYRCFFASRSPLAKLFRKFIVNLVDHIVTHEAELLRKISAKFQVDNPELIEQGMNDLQNKLIDYEKKLIEEQEKNKLLEQQCELERHKRLETEEEKVEVEMVNSFNMMHIEQLKKEKTTFINKIKNIKDDLIHNNESIDQMEIRLIKEKYMKQLNVYILHPQYFIKLLKNKKKELIAMQSSDSDDDDMEIDAKMKKSNIQELEFLINDTSYARNFDHIFSDNIKGIQIEHDEILYYYLSFGRNIAKKDKIIYVNNQWVDNRIHFGKILETLSNTCDILHLNKIQLYKTSIEDICGVVREEFINL